MKIQKIILLSRLISLFLIISCTTIASLIDEPTLPKTESLKDISTYEAKLSDYIMYLQVFLTRTQKKVKDPNYPKFTYFNPTELKSEHTVEDLKFNIKLFQDYISITKPIAKDVYRRYSKLKN
ncbi:Outer surface protein [Borrelia duttonii CR2A]|uniref:Outer surface protein n=1 Tax=Borrelia duttonii CR2A TaxID=1432657 RepID=W6TG30_9SPIR|nr:BBA14 family lipoprotein [Borrelia duttonii]ETZ17350.1 Outer surface protein [Borrelia duttonii CR2A]